MFQYAKIIYVKDCGNPKSITQMLVIIRYKVAKQVDIRATNSWQLKQI